MDVFLFAVGVFLPDPATIFFLKSLPGFIAVHPSPEYTLLCFDTLENAIVSRGKWTETGEQAGRYIMNATMQPEKGLLTVKHPAWDSQGGKMQ